MKRIIIAIAAAFAACTTPDPITSTTAQPAINGDPGNCFPDPETGQCVCQDSPVILDLESDGVDLTDYVGGVVFRLRSDREWLWSWTAPGSDDAWLALPGSDGIVNDGSELFGNNSLQASTAGDPNGFRALAFYDLAVQGGNSDGKITAADAIYTQLRLWRDVSHDGVSQSAELISLIRAGVHELSTAYQSTSVVDEHGNQFRYASTIVADAPIAPTVYDVWLVGAPTAGSGSGSGTTNTESEIDYFCKVGCYTVLAAQANVFSPTTACPHDFLSETFTRAPASLGTLSTKTGTGYDTDRSVALQEARSDCNRMYSTQSAPCARWIPGGFYPLITNTPDSCRQLMPPTGGGCTP